MNRRPTPETAHALVALLDRKGTLFEDNAPEELVTLCRRLEIERNELRSDLEFRRGLFKLQEQQMDLLREQRDTIILRLGETQERYIDADRQRDELRAYADRLKSAIHETIMENLHLADGDDCTLKRLKDSIRFDLPNE